VHSAAQIDCCRSNFSRFAHSGRRTVSPPRADSDPESCRNAVRDEAQTGSRETWFSGAQQIRQSAGKKVKNKLASVRFGARTKTASAQPSLTNPSFAVWIRATWPSVARIRNPVLLKTPSRKRQAFPLDRANTASIAALALATQSGCRDSSIRKFGPVVPCAADDRVPQCHGTYSCGDSTARNAPSVTTLSGARTSQRIHEGESDRLPGIRNPGSETLKKNGPMHYSTGETQNRPIVRLS
jgi:hypothetical protein